MASLTDDAIARIQQMIVSGELQPGQRLPPEGGLQLCDAVVDGAQLRLVVLGKVDAGTLEGQQLALQPVRGRRVELHLARFHADGERCEPVVEAPVEVDGITVGRQLRRDRLVRGVEDGVRVGWLLGVEGVQRPGEQLTR